MKPLGDAFINLVKMIIAPVIFLTIVTGIASMTHLRTVGRVFAKAMAYFLFFSTLALIVGMIVAHVVQPGAGMNINPAELDQTAVHSYVEKSHDLTLVGFLMDIIPKTLLSAFVDGNILQVLFVAVLFGIALAMVGEEPVLNFLEALVAPVFKLVHILMKAAPIGAFGAIAFTIGKYGVGSLINLAWLVGSFYLTAFLFVAVILGLVCRLCGFSVFKLARYLKAELLLVLGTSSSESALPSLMEDGTRRLQQVGGGPGGADRLLVQPGRYQHLHDPGGAVHRPGHQYRTDPGPPDRPAAGRHAQLKGAAGVTGAGFITLAATLAVVPEVPVAGMALILGVDRFARRMPLAHQLHRQCRGHRGGLALGRRAGPQPPAAGAGWPRKRAAAAGRCTARGAAGKGLIQVCGTAGPATTVGRPAAFGASHGCHGQRRCWSGLRSHTAQECAVAAWLRQDSDRSNASNGGMIPCPFCPFM